MMSQFHEHCQGFPGSFHVLARRAERRRLPGRQGERAPARAAALENVHVMVGVESLCVLAEEAETVWTRHK